MTNVLKMGKIPEPESPWWENTTIICDVCESAFLLEQSDFDTEQWVERQEKKPGGSHTVEGRCPVCKAPMLIDVKELLAKTAHGERRYAANNERANILARGYREGGAGDDTA